MLVLLSEEHKEHVSLLARLQTEVSLELLRVAVEFLRGGVKTPRKYESAARVLGEPVEVVQRAVEGLMYLLAEASRMEVSAEVFSAWLNELELPGSVGAQLGQVYAQGKAEVRGLLGHLGPASDRYHDLEWRLDVQVASRAGGRQQQRRPLPRVALRLTTSGGPGGVEPRAVAMEVAPATLLHAVRSLEAALDEGRDVHARRIARNVK
uniref:COMM domain-containing protein 2 n=1 Tax=Petromyzon marinus TaxID=7757 RepID=A0AAJ7UFM6_PETMA|nr:COMM domain-containing protein 2 [Petromyzon marinus]XP_032835479.1 COMM domain-containing protein 2 [Petromyzon marinus]XP_032835480.1 COMM domain-containing protein 2 [Petromyzon marinus]